MKEKKKIDSAVSSLGRNSQSSRIDTAVRLEIKSSTTINFQLLVLDSALNLSFLISRRYFDHIRKNIDIFTFN